MIRPNLFSSIEGSAQIDGNEAQTIERLKGDIAGKGIKFFDEIDQSRLAADAGIKLRPSVLLVAGFDDEFWQEGPIGQRVKLAESSRMQERILALLNQDRLPPRARPQP